MTKTIKLNAKQYTPSDVKKILKKPIFKDTIAGPMPRYDMNAVSVERVIAFLPNYNIYGTFHCYAYSHVPSSSNMSENSQSMFSDMVRLFRS